MSAKSDVHAAAPLADGRYHLLEVLGEGGMAMVYRGFDVRLHVPRAIKVLSPNLAGKRALRERFEAEARTMALFDHPNIVRVVDVGIDGDRVYIVMELVSGGSLLERVRDFGPLPPRTALDVMIDALRAIQAAHDHGVVHRDIKPHNILLTDKGQVRVTDFGIARLVEGDDVDDALTRTGAVMGTWGFMAPEQKENAKAVDMRADLYSAGATLWAIVTNQTPGHLFAADLDATMMQGIPEPLANFIKRATRYRRDDRFGSATEMLEAALLVRDELDPAPPDTPPLGARGASPRVLTPPAGTYADGPAPKKQARQGVTMVPDMTPVPDTGAVALGEGAASPSGDENGSTWTSGVQPAPTNSGASWPWRKTDAESIEVDLGEPPPRSGLLTFAALGLLAVLVAGGMAALLPRTLESHPATPVTSKAVATKANAAAPALPDAVDQAPVAVAEGASTEAPGSASSSARSAPVSGSSAGSAARTPRESAGATRAPETSARPARGPALSHTALKAASAGQQVEIKARVTGSSAYSDVRLNYRPMGTAQWSNQPMYPQGDQLVASLSASGPLAQGFEYFILARPDDPDLPPLSSGSYKSPYRVSVE